jgi:DNA-binding LacI/PurR family transcriptional regulator
VKPVRKSKLAELAAEQVLAELKRGTWTERLPGVRALSAWLHISPPTLAQALRVLVDRGLLEDCGPRRRYKILADGVTSPALPAGPQRRHLLILTHHALHRTATSTRGILERIVANASTAGWTVGFEVMDFFNARRPRRAWDETVAALRPDAMIGVFGRPVLAQWAAARGHRMMFLGGVSTEERVPVFSVRADELLRPALQRLIAAGHRKICLPLSERAGPLNERLIATMTDEFAAAGLPFAARIHAPVTAYSSPEITRSLVEQGLDRAGITAWVFIDWREYVAAQGVFQRRGLKVPEQASVVVLIGEPVAEWHFPALSRFEMPADALARQTVHWLEQPLMPHESRSFPATWIEGATIVPLENSNAAR